MIHRTEETECHTARGDTLGAGAVLWSRRLAGLLCLGLALLSAGCASSKRMTYTYDPAYGVENPEFFRSLQAFRMGMRSGNKLALLENGDSYFTDMLQAITNAQRSINIELYIFAGDQIGTQFAKALAERARAGLEVRVLVDDLGSRLGALADEMEAAGVKFRVYKPIRIYALHKTGERTHRKIVVVDGRIGYVGGFGFDDRWRGNARTPEEWRDLAVRMEGTVVAQLQSVFLEDWMHTTGEVLNGDSQFPPQAQPGSAEAQVVASSGNDQSSMAKLLFYMAIQASRKRVWIENAYFVPDRQIRKALVHAAQRGVDVRVVVPGTHMDIDPILRAARFHYGELLKGGVQVFEYETSMLHTKAMVVDSVWTTVGSINLTDRSMRRNAEANVSIYDHAFAENMERVVLKDIDQSHAYSLQEWKHRGLWERCRELYSTLFSNAY